MALAHEESEANGDLFDLADGSGHPLARQLVGRYEHNKQAIHDPNPELASSG
jgi:hypothetical protein